MGSAYLDGWLLAARTLLEIALFLFGRLVVGLLGWLASRRWQMRNEPNILSLMSFFDMRGQK